MLVSKETDQAQQQWMKAMESIQVHTLTRAVDLQLSQISMPTMWQAVEQQTTTLSTQTLTHQNQGLEHSKDTEKNLTH